MIQPGDDRHARLIEQAYKEPDYEVGNIEFIVRGGYVANAGTNEWRDWVTNLRQFPVWVRGLGFVPAGYNSVAKKQTVKLLALDVNGEVNLRDAILMGHSAGGAVIMLTAARLALLGINVRRVITFGAPDVGKLKVLTRLVAVDQIVNGNDKVPGSTFYGEAVERDYIGLPDGFDHPIAAYAEELEGMN